MLGMTYAPPPQRPYLSCMLAARFRPRWRSRLIGRLRLTLTVMLVGIAGGCGGQEPDYPRDYEVGFSNNAVSQGVAPLEEVTSRLAQIGAEVDRIQISWAALEPEPGQFDFEGLDQVYEADLRAGIEPLFNLAFAPAWAAAEGPCDPSVASCHLPPAPEHYDDFAKTAAKVAGRYPQARAIEIWNEPNTAYFWQPGADPDGYAELLRRSHAAVKRVAPEMPVAGASTAASPGGRPGYIEDQEFIARLYELGSAQSMDALSVHVYPSPAAPSTTGVMDDIAQIEETRGRFAVDDPIWVTETGGSTTGEPALTVAEQRRILPELANALGDRSAVEMVLLHTLFRKPTGPGSPETGFGIVEPAGEPLPVFCDLAERWGGPGC